MGLLGRSSTVHPFDDQGPAMRKSNISVMSTYEEQRGRKLLQRILSIRCISVSAAVIFIALSSSIITALGGVTQTALIKEVLEVKHWDASQLVRAYLDKTLGWTDDAVSQWSLYLQRRRTIEPNWNQTRVEMYHYATELNFARDLGSIRANGFEIDFTWVNGKCIGVESYHYAMDTFENFYVNDSYSEERLYHIDMDTDFRSINLSDTMFTLNYNGSFWYIPGQGLTCDAPRWWVPLTYYPGYDPPIAVLCRRANFCYNGTQEILGQTDACVGMNQLVDMLSTVIKDLRNDGALIYVADDLGNLVATSTNLFPFDLDTGIQYTINNTNIDWINVAYQAYIHQREVVSYNGEEYQLASLKYQYSNDNLNWVIVQLVPIPKNNYVRDALIINILMCVGATVFLMITVYFITKSLYQMSNVLEKMSKLDLELSGLTEPPFLEASRLYKSFLIMHAALSSFQKYVPVEIISHILKSKREAIPYLKNEICTVYFQDIKDFTSLAEEEDPDVLAAITEEYMEAMTEIITENGGVVDKYIGDCIMALFNLPSSLHDHEAAACRAALDCTRQLHHLNQRWKKMYNIELWHRIGINTGMVLAGNIGSSRRIAFTCIGDNVNLASRVENANKYYGTNVLITEATHNRIPPNLFMSRKIAIIRVAGKKSETAVYEITRDRSSANERLFSSYSSALLSYELQQLNQARARVQDILEEFPADPPTLHLKERVEAAMSGSPHDWSPVEVLAK
ncbi:hypothetical protein PROFUN_11043 [Planoprotostelium fungivorum]|uniref:Guanylate cyclase domain-containing protein n=1 Tax=Planoprotostelium fungivorum TaxID=1890364 RepID=A0A2P6NBM4_9EUKA|nr:hypothetical protein PROFUN_11043 [Planoprotostelium fungivorum]